MARAICRHIRSHRNAAGKCSTIRRTDRMTHTASLINRSRRVVTCASAQTVPRGARCCSWRSHRRSQGRAADELEDLMPDLARLAGIVETAGQALGSPTCASIALSSTAPPSGTGVGLVEGCHDRLRLGVEFEGDLRHIRETRSLFCLIVRRIFQVRPPRARRPPGPGAPWPPPLGRPAARSWWCWP